MARLAHPPATRRRPRRAVRPRRAGIASRARSSQPSSSMSSRSSTARDALSLTGALTRSLRAAHEHLRDWNRKSLQGAPRRRRRELHRAARRRRVPRAGRARASRTCAPPTATFAASQPERVDFEHALGVAEEFEPHADAHRARARRPRARSRRRSSTRSCPRDHVERILERGADDALPELYLLCRDRPNMALVLLVVFRRGAGDAAGVPDARRRRNGRPTIVPAGRRAGAPRDRRARRRARWRRARPGGGVARGRDRSAMSPLPPRPIQEQVREITESTAPPPATGRAPPRRQRDAALPRARRARSRCRRSGSRSSWSFAAVALVDRRTARVLATFRGPGGEPRGASSRRSSRTRARTTPALRRRAIPAQAPAAHGRADEARRRREDPRRQRRRCSRSRPTWPPRSACWTPCTRSRTSPPSSISRR